MSFSIHKSRLALDFISRNSSLGAAIDGVLEELSKNPFADGKTKVYWQAPPLVFTLCIKEGLWILYYVDRSCDQIKIWNIGKRGEKPTFR